MFSNSNGVMSKRHGRVANLKGLPLAKFGIIRRSKYIMMITGNTSEFKKKFSKSTEILKIND